MLRATSRLGERPPSPRGSSALRHVGSPKIAVLGAAGGYLILPVLLSALGLLGGDVCARETQPGRRWKGWGGPGSSSTPGKGHGDLLQKAALAGGRAGDGQAAGHPIAWVSCQGLLQPPWAPRLRSPASGTPRGHARSAGAPHVPGALGTAPWPPLHSFGRSAMLARSGEEVMLGGSSDPSFLRPESQPTTSDETVVAGGTVVLKCQVEDPDDSSLQWSNPAQQTLYFGEKRGACGDPGTGRGRQG